MYSFYESLFCKESLLINILILCHIIILIKFHESYISFLTSLLLIICYFYFSEIKNKTRLFLTFSNEFKYFVNIW